jgi:hypothetical protein
VAFRGRVLDCVASACLDCFLINSTPVIILRTKLNPGALLGFLHSVLPLLTVESQAAFPIPDWDLQRSVALLPHSRVVGGAGFLFRYANLR